MVKQHVKKIKRNDLFEKFVLLVAIVEPLATIPQIIELYKSQNAESLSLLSWVLFMVASIVWLIYGIRTKSTPLIASSVLWASTEVALIVGIIIYS